MNNPEKLKLHKLLSALIIMVGIVLLMYMIIVESEPGAIPLLLTIIGAVWYLITRYKIRSQHEQR